jgi:hypothetical protein
MSRRVFWRIWRVTQRIEIGKQLPESSAVDQAFFRIKLRLYALGKSGKTGGSESFLENRPERAELQ